MPFPACLKPRKRGAFYWQCFGLKSQMAVPESEWFAERWGCDDNRTKSIFCHCMKDESYPQEITEVEKNLGFELLFLEAYGFPHETIPPLSDVRVVAKRLSPFDVVVKSIVVGNLVYVHKRFGKEAAQKEAKEEWFPVSGGNSDARQAVIIAQAGYAAAPYSKEIILVPFRYHAV
jgi:hypothetical protein